MSSSYDHRAASTDGRGFRPRTYHDPGRRSREHSPDRSSARLRPDDRYYSNRYSYPVPRAARSPDARQKRRSWPPSPAVEDEKDSDKDDAQSRGTLEQYPIILDVPEEAAKALEALGKQAVPSKHTDGSSAKKASEGDDVQRGRPRTPSNGSVHDEPLIFTRRQASPYVFTPKAPLTTGDSQDSGYFSSRDMKSPADFASPSEKRGGANPTHAKPQIHGASLALPKDLGYEEAIDSTDDESYQAIPDRKPARYSSVRTDLEGEELRNSLREMMAGNNQPPRVAALKAETLEPRRSSDSASTMMRPRLDDLSRPAPSSSGRGIPPPIVTSLASGAALSAIGLGIQQNNRSRPSSPTGLRSLPPSPTVSSHQNSPQNGVSSRPGSRSASRPSSPSSSDHSKISERADDSPRRASTFPALQDDRTQRTSRLASSILPPGSTSAGPRIKVLSPSPARPANSLPYPVDDLKVVMPSEERHRYDPGKSNTGYNTPRFPQDVPRSPRGSPRPSVSLESPSRPPMTTRHTSSGYPVAAGTLPIAGTLPLAAKKDETAQRPQLNTSSSETLKPCPRVQLTRDFDDWYGLEGIPSFNICPPCLQSNFSDPAFRVRFKRQAAKDRNAPVKCDFGSPWMRLAWILTKQQKRMDLNLLYSVANINTTERECAGSTRESRTWYTVLNQRGDPVNNFDVCYCDVKKIEALLPTLRGVFVRAYTHNHRRKCDLRSDSMRFPTYLDSLIDINDKAIRSRKPPELQPFTQLAGNKAQTRECSRDDLIFDQCWHLIPQLPELTVCEECYTDIVWPAIANGSSVASRFNRTPQLVPEGSRGTSCQLYSDRMRHVFRKAVRRGDFKYLTERAKERKGMELDLHAGVARAKHKYRDRGDVLQEELGKIAAEWRKWE